MIRVYTIDSGETLHAGTAAGQLAAEHERAAEQSLQPRLLTVTEAHNMQRVMQERFKSVIAAQVLAEL